MRHLVALLSRSGVFNEGEEAWRRSRYVTSHERASGPVASRYLRRGVAEIRRRGRGRGRCSRDRRGKEGKEEGRDDDAERKKKRNRQIGS